MLYYLLYDEDCSLCVRFQAGVKKRDRNNLIEPVGFMDPRIPRIVPRMSREDLLNSFHLIFPDGKTFSGNNAMPEILLLLPSLKIIGWVLKYLPGVKFFSEKIYVWVASHRK